jgi:hypothetical protein
VELMRFKNSPSSIQDHLFLKLISKSLSIALIK